MIRHGHQWWDSSFSLYGTEAQRYRRHMYFKAFLPPKQRGHGGFNRQRIFFTYSKFNDRLQFSVFFNSTDEIHRRLPERSVRSQRNVSTAPRARAYHTRLDKTPNIHAKHAARDLLLNNECLRTTIAPFFLFRTTYYLYVRFFFFFTYHIIRCAVLLHYFY